MAYDFVIIGGGSAGSVLAARLSENQSQSVCLLEAGGMGRGLLHRVPIGAAAFISGRPKIGNWAYNTVPQPGLGGRRGYQPRGKVLGGTSAINAMLYTRGHPSDYDDWAKAGCDGWSWKEVLPYFLRAECNERGAGDLHGADGPLQVSNQKSPRPISRAFIDAAGEMQISENRDFNGPDQEGAGLYQVTQFHAGARHGERCSAAAAYLHPNLHRPNLTVVTGAHATGLIIDGKRAIGVRYQRRGREEKVQAKREVILCGGTFNSPQLLMLSGIGPASELQSHGIPVAHELPGVGRNLQDHLDFILLYRSRDKDVLGLSPAGVLNMLKAAGQWRKTGTGLLATPFAEAGAFIKSDPALARPDLQLHFVVALVDDHLRKIHFGLGYSCHVCVLRPYSRGEVGLNDANPFSPPRIDPQFLADERDAALLLRGVKITRQIMEAPALERFRGKEIYTQGVTADTELMKHIRARADTIYHPAGTCKMGVDEMAVVDPLLRVRGMQGLRVADASIMPSLIGGNTNAPVIMIAEKAAGIIRSG